MDNYREEIVVRKQGKTLYAIAYIFAWVCIVLFGLMGVLYLSQLMGMDFSAATIIGFLLFGGVAVFLYFYKDNLRTEYEYTFTNGEIDFAKVLGNKRRKALMSVRMREVEAGGPVDGSQFDKYVSNREVKKINYFLNTKGDLFFVYFVREGKRQVIVFEPTEKLVDMMCQYSKVLEQ